MITESLNEVKSQIDRIFPHALDVLVGELDQQYAAAIAPLDSEAAALAAEYAGIAEEAQKLATVLPRWAGKRNARWIDWCWLATIARPG